MFSNARSHWLLSMSLRLKEPPTLYIFPCQGAARPCSTLTSSSQPSLTDYICKDVGSKYHFDNYIVLLHWFCSLYLRTQKGRAVLDHISVNWQLVDICQLTVWHTPAELCFNWTSSLHSNCFFAFVWSGLSDVFDCLLWSKYSLQSTHACTLVTW